MPAEQERTAATAIPDPHRAVALRPDLRMAHRVRGRVRVELAMSAPDTPVLPIFIRA
jgi:hypothetical protein